MATAADKEYLAQQRQSLGLQLEAQRSRQLGPVGNPFAGRRLRAGGPLSANYSVAPFTDDAVTPPPPPPPPPGGGTNPPPKPKPKPKPKPTPKPKPLPKPRPRPKPQPQPKPKPKPRPRPRPRPHKPPAQRPPGGTGSCFVAGTMIATPEGDKPIEQIQVGDAVLCVSDDLSVVRGTVTNVHVHLDDTEKRLRVALADGWRFEATEGHRFFHPDCGEWHALKEYGESDYLATVTGLIVGDRPIDSIVEVEHEPDTVYNLSVEPHPTYVANGVLAHNAKTTGPG